MHFSLCVNYGNYLVEKLPHKDLPALNFENETAVFDL